MLQPCEGEMAIRKGIISYIMDTNLKDVALKYLTKNVNLIDGDVTFFEQFYQQIKGDTSDSLKGEKA